MQVVMNASNGSSVGLSLRPTGMDVFFFTREMMSPAAWKLFEKTLAADGEEKFSSSISAPNFSKALAWSIQRSTF